jgi:DNA-directed RNA polymerase subunit beta
MNKVFVNNINELNELQRSSFLNFIFNNVNLELKNFPKSFNTRILLNRKYRPVFFSINLNFNKIKYENSEYNINECFIDKKTYSTKLYVESTYSYYIKIRSKNLKKKYTIKKNIFFGEIPLMTQDGTFIIDGYQRIIISQIIRSPGIFFNKEINSNKKNIYSATVISDKGFWIKFILDEDIEYKSNKNSKLRLYMELQNLDAFKSLLVENNEKLIEEDNKIFIFDLINFLNFKEPEIDFKEEFNIKNTTLKLSKDTFSDIRIKSLLDEENLNLFSIGEIGRYKINKNLNLNLDKKLTYLTSLDFARIIKGLLELKYKNRDTDDIDHLKNKQIRSVGDFLQKQFKLGIYKLKNNLLETSEERKIKITKTLKKFIFKKSKKIDNIFDETILIKTFKEFFKLSELSQFMDQINPLSEQTHKSKVSVFGPNGIKRDNINSKIRDIHPSQYNRFCSIETPEGQGAGLTSSITLFGRTNELGWIETPYFLVNKKKILSNKNPIYLNPEQESKLSVAFPDILINNDKKITENYTLVKKNYSFLNKKSNLINLITTNPLQIMSLAASLIPFMEHNDANRALMGTSMQKQAVPLLYTQKPLIGTNLESISVLDSTIVIKSYCEGIVENVFGAYIKIKDNLNQNIYYYLQKYIKSNQNTSINNKPIVWTGEKIYSGQIIADGSSTEDGELSLGRNLTIAYMPWEGYNYEDAILINERLIFDNTLTSILIQEIETKISLSNNFETSEILTNKIKSKDRYLYRNLNSQGIVKVGSYVNINDALVGKVNIIEKEYSYISSLMKAINFDDEYLLDQQEEDDFDFEDKSLYVPYSYSGRVVGVRIINKKINNEENNISIRIYIASIKKIGVGDKLSGRHGNKGIISKILSQNDMPYLPDGTPVDIILNPLGVPSRMNVGQLFECLFGLASEKLGYRFKVNPFDEVYGKEASRILVNQKLKEASIKTNSNWVFNSKFPGKILLKDGRTGEYFDNPVTVGKSYILKLIHLVDSKIHARSIGPYTTNIQQPVSGKMQEGGQRFGEMEVWALEAYGCSNTLQEILTVKSDDIDGRTDMFESIKNNLEKPNVSIPDSFLSLIRELNSLGLNFSLKKYENNFYSTLKTKTSNYDIFKDLESRLKLRRSLIEN